MKRFFGIGLAGMLLLLSGCDVQKEFWKAAESGEERISIPDTLGESGEISYRVPESRPNIMTDQIGYRTDGRKTAVFLSKEQKGPFAFRVVESQTERIVFRGTTEEKGMDASAEEYISYGVFTELTEAGQYYVEADGLGRSCVFGIGDDIYSGVYRSLYQALEESVHTNNIQQNCFVLTNLLTAYELYGEVSMYELADRAGEQQNKEQQTGQERIPDILILGKTVFEKLSALQNGADGSLGGDATKTAAFAGAAAQFARLYREYDGPFAAQCQKAAEKAWNYAEREGAEADERYAAAAQLFRLTGKAAYHTVIREYHKTSGQQQKGIYDMEIYGDVTYLMTENNVDVELCRERMSERMEEVERIAAQSHENLYQTVNGPQLEHTDQMLRQMVKLAIVDYVITNHEYATVMEDHLHFFLGRNPEGVSILNGLGAYSGGDRRQDILRNPEESAELLFMMSAVLDHELDAQQDMQ